MSTEDLMRTHVDVDHDAQELSEALEEPSEGDDLLARLLTLERDLVRHFDAQEQLVNAAAEALGAPLQESEDLARHRDRLFSAIGNIRSDLQRGTASPQIDRALRELQEFLAEFDRLTETEWQFITQYGAVTFPSLGGG